jgi:branched-chain amino acid transport system substrate-binding protein
VIPTPTWEEYNATETSDCRNHPGRYTGGRSAAGFCRELFVPLFSYRTGPYAGSGIPIANGMHDYLTMLNERDGGINGVKIRVGECETGYDTQKGVECYEQVKGEGALVISPYSTGITLQVIPKASVDKIPVLSMAYGLSAAAEGNTFPWVFNPPTPTGTVPRRSSPTLHAVKAAQRLSRARRSVTSSSTPAMAASRSRFSSRWPADMGFELLQYPVPGKEMQNQSSQWLNIRRDRPDYMIMWGWGAMSPTAVKEATKIRYPMDKFYGIWWSGGNDDAAAGGEAAKGYRTLNFHGVGSDFGVIQDIKKHVVDAGKSQVDPAKFADNLYNRGVYNSMLIAEGIRRAQELTGKTVIDATDMRNGLENLDITEARLKEIGMEGFALPMKLSCEDHSGHHKVYVVEWDGKDWQKAGDWFSPDVDMVKPLLKKAAADYAESNAPWPERTEACLN